MARKLLATNVYFTQNFTSKELADLRAALAAAEQKWYNEGFDDAENYAEPVVARARNLGFEAGWFAALQAMGAPEDSHLRDPGQIPFPSPVPVIQEAPAAIDVEETASMRELVKPPASQLCRSLSVKTRLSA